MGALVSLSDQITAVESIAKEYGLQSLSSLAPMAQTFKMAEGIARLKEAITPDLMRSVMALQNTGLGFLTDKQQGGYDGETVKSVMIEATIRGLRMVGNETNIIAGKFYATKNGLLRLILDWEGLTEFELQQGVPRTEGTKCVVDCIASWRLDVAPMQLEKRGKEAIPIRVNSGMGDDAVLGKAKRKMYALVIDKLTGMRDAVPTGEVADVVEGTVVQPERKVKRSSLNDMPSEPAKQPVNEAEELAAALDAIQMAKELSVVADAQKAATAAGLSADAMGKVNKAANERRKQLRNLFSDAGT